MSILESVDELTDLAVSLFSSIPNRGKDPRPVVTDPVWSAEQKGVRPFMSLPFSWLTSAFRVTLVDCLRQDRQRLSRV